MEKPFIPSFYSRWRTTKNGKILCLRDSSENQKKKKKTKKMKKINSIKTNKLVLLLHHIDPILAPNISFRSFRVILTVAHSIRDILRVLMFQISPTQLQIPLTPSLNQHRRHSFAPAILPPTAVPAGPRLLNRKRQGQGILQRRCGSHRHRDLAVSPRRRLRSGFRR